MKIFCIGLVLTLLSGCATTGKYEARLQSWVGRDANDLIAAWGPPDSTYQMSNGRKAFTWQKSYGASSVIYPDMAFTRLRSCKTTFFADASEKIQTWRWEGNRCRSK